MLLSCSYSNRLARRQRNRAGTNALRSPSFSHLTRGAEASIGTRSHTVYPAHLHMHWMAITCAGRAGDFRQGEAQTFLLGRYLCLSKVLHCGPDWPAYACSIHGALRSSSDVETSPGGQALTTTLKLWSGIVLHASLVEKQELLPNPPAASCIGHHTPGSTSSRTSVVRSIGTQSFTISASW